MKMGRLRSMWNCLKFQQSVTDNIVFQLQWKITFIILLLLSIIVACRQYFGDSIDCITKDDIPTSLLNKFCYIHPTFSIGESWEKTVGYEIPYPGVDKYRPNEARVYHTYYQWVSMVLFLQAILFLVPRYFWRNMEGQKIEKMTSDLQSSSVNIKENLEVLRDEVSANFNNNQKYFAFYWVAEVLNLVNITGQMFLMDAFLGGYFWDFGFHVIKFFSSDGKSPYHYSGMLRVFPRLTKCTFHRYGSSGDVQRHDAMCILPMNILNEKIYAFLWFWFLALEVLAVCAVVYRLLIFFTPGFRLFILKLRTRKDCKNLVHTVLKKGNAGDWFVLYLLSKNLKPVHFSKLIYALADIPEGSNINMNTLDSITLKL